MFRNGVFTKMSVEQTGIKHNPAGVYLMSSSIRDFGIMPTRTIGDRDFSKDGVICIPETKMGKLESGESLILVTDGCDNLTKDQLDGTANDIVLRAYEYGSSDNISAIVITKE
jgi:serine/threonine protein phosphatase PrpC